MDGGGGIVLSGLENGPAVTTGALPGGTVGASYSTTLAASAGTPPYHWSVVGGSLPPGLALNAATGVIAGTPTSADSVNLTLQVNDQNGQSASITVPLNVDSAGTSGCSGTGTGNATAPGGYWLAGTNGAVYSCGNAPFFGSLVTLGVTPAKPIVGIAATPDGEGYWLVGSDGGLFAFGDAGFYGSMGGKPLNKPVVGIAATPQGGYFEVASDGGLFAFGPGANFYGSMGGKPLNQPVVGMAETTSGDYYEVASDGGIFAFGPKIPFYGSMGDKPLNRPVVGIAVNPGGGYYEVASDGGIFAFGGPFHGSTGCLSLVQPIVAMVVSPDTTTVGTGTACNTKAQAAGGYQFVAGDGGVFSFGNATFAGSLGGSGVAGIEGMAES